MHQLTSDFKTLAQIVTAETPYNASDLFEKMIDVLIKRLVQEISPDEIRALICDVCEAPRYVFEEYNLNKILAKI